MATDPIPTGRGGMIAAAMIAILLVAALIAVGG